jgi:hypothetical protein
MYITTLWSCLPPHPTPTMSDYITTLGSSCPPTPGLQSAEDVGGPGQTPTEPPLVVHRVAAISATCELC